jgi:hypothetical protein
LNFKCDKCGWHVPVSGGDKCSECARKEAMDFCSAVRRKQKPTHLTPLHEKVWAGIVEDGRKWRVSDKYIAPCGHPHVKDTQGKCIFCRFEQYAPVQPVTPLEQYVINLKQSVTELRKRADAAEAEVLSIEAGFYVPERVTTKSARQFAVERGEKWYQHDEPCKHCGVVSERYVANGRCRNCGK